MLKGVNDVKNGGTQFENGNEWINIENKQGTVVIFDMNIKHKGNPAMENKNKYILGIRLF
jgi:hypothetical protein